MEETKSNCRYHRLVEVAIVSKTLTGNRGANRPDRVTVGRCTHPDGADAAGINGEVRCNGDKAKCVI